MFLSPLTNRRHWETQRPLCPVKVLCGEMRESFSFFATEGREGAPHRLNTQCLKFRLVIFFFLHFWGGGNPNYCWEIRWAFRHRVAKKKKKKKMEAFDTVLTQLPILIVFSPSALPFPATHTHTHTHTHTLFPPYIVISVYLWGMASNEMEQKREGWLETDERSKRRRGRGEKSERGRKWE